MLTLKETTSMSKENDRSGIAALSICEALLLTLNDLNILPESEIIGLLRDAASTHENAVGSEAEVETGKAVAELINNIIVNVKLVRRP